MKKLLLALSLLVPLSAGAAFPTVVAVESTVDSTAAASHALNIPDDSCLASESLVAGVFSSEPTDTITFSGGGWDVKTTRGANSEGGIIAYHECSGSEGATVTVNFSAGTANSKMLGVVYKISGNDRSADPEASSTGGAATTTPDPPSLSPTGGSKDYLWITIAIQDDLGPFNACPTNYTGGNCAFAATTGAGASSLAMGYSHRTNAAASEDPGTFTSANSDTWDAFTVAVHPSSATPPSFSAAPSCSATTDGVSCTYTASAASTAYGVCVAPADGTPSAAQIIAGNNDGGTAAIMAGSDANSGGADTIVVTGTHPIPKVDCHFVLSNGDGNSSVDSSQTDKLRSPRSGYAIVTMAAATNICDLDADFDPDCAAGDVFEYETATNENAGCAVAIGTDGDVTLTPGSAGDCDGLRTFEYCPEDVSNTTTALFTAPACDFDTDDTAYINDSPPTCSISVTQLVLDEDEAMTPVDLEVLGDCQDPDGDTLSYAVTSGTLPNGTALSGTGDRDWTGTPDTEDEAGEALTVTVTDPAGESTTFEFTVYTVDTWTVPNLVGRTASEAASDICDAALWRCEDVGLSISGLTCDAGTAGLVLTQDPAAAAEAEPFEAITTTLSRTCAAAGTRTLQKLRNAPPKAMRELR